MGGGAGCPSSVRVVLFDVDSSEILGMVGEGIVETVVEVMEVYTLVGFREYGCVGRDKIWAFRDRFDSGRGVGCVVIDESWRGPIDRGRLL